MKYGDATQTLLESFPELSEPYQRLKANSSGNPGNYIVFEDVFGEYIWRLLALQSSHVRNRKLSDAFKFIDSMIEAGGDVADLAFVGMLEGMPGWWYQRASPFFSEPIIQALTNWREDWRELCSEEQPDPEARADTYSVGDTVHRLMGPYGSN